MAWTTPTTRTTGEKITDSIWNTDVVDNLIYLYDSGYICIADEKAQNTDGGTFTLGAWRTRDLNTIKTDTAGIASLSSNQVTLPAGSYFVQWSAPAVGVLENQTRLQNITAGTTLILGQSGYSASASLVANEFSCGFGLFTLSVSSVIALQHYSLGTIATYGFGYASNITTEVYSVIQFWRR